MNSMSNHCHHCIAWVKTLFSHMGARIGVTQFILSGFIAYFINCVASNKMLFLDGILSTNAQISIIRYSPRIMFIALGLNFILFIVARLRVASWKERKIYGNICRHVFEKFITDNCKDKNLFCVTIFKAHHQDTPDPYLKAIGRYQIKSPVHNTKVKFKSGEGCAGMAYESCQIVKEEIIAFNKNNPNRYIEDSSRVFNLPRNKAVKLNHKACSFLCVPITYFDTKKPWGILSIDCLTRKNLEHILPREIEATMENFSPFFMEEPR